MSEYKKSYIQMSRAYYSKNMEDRKYVEEVMFGLHSDDGGTKGELALRWYDFRDEIAARLEVYDDSWRFLNSLPELIPALEKFSDTSISPKQFCELLDSLGFEDITPIEMT